MKQLFIALCMLCGISTTSVVAEEIKVEGGGAAISSVFLPMKDSFEKATGDKLTASITSPAKGLLALDQGLIDIATCSYPIDELFALADKEGIKVDHFSFWSIIVATNKTVAFVHKTNPVKKLSREQLRGIFSGRITNWRQVGGENRPITVVWGHNTSGQNALFIKEIMDGIAITKQAVAATDYKNVRDVISSSPGAIGIDPIGFKSAEIRTPEVPAIISPIIAVTKGAPSAKVLKVIDFYRQNIHFMD